MPAITVAFDARPLDPEMRHWGPGVFVENIVKRLSGRVRFRGLAHRFPGGDALGIVSWPCIPKTGRVFFALSPALGWPFDLYWGTNHLLPHLLRKPSVLTVHDMLLLNGLDGRERLLARGFSSSVRRASRIIAVSEATANDLIRIFPEVAAKIEVIHQGFDVSAQTLESLRKRLPCKATPFTVMLGAHRPRKNLQLAVSAITRLAAEGSAVRLVVTGNVHASFRDVFRKSNGLIEERGVLPKEELFQLLAKALALLFPSRYEGFGFPMLEAMAAGCPVLALDTPINREIGGGAAWLLPEDSVEWAKAIRHLSESSAAREELILRGGENLRRFSWEKTASAYGETFQEICR